MQVVFKQYFNDAFTLVLVKQLKTLVYEQFDVYYNAVAADKYLVLVNVIGLVLLSIILRKVFDFLTNGWFSFVEKVVVILIYAVAIWGMFFFYFGFLFFNFNFFQDFLFK